MRISYTKYPFRVFSLAIMLGFVFSNFSLCSLLIINCEVENISCCSEICEETSSAASQTENGCCCEITEAPKQPAEIIPSVYDISKKNITYTIQYTNSENIDNDNHKLAIMKNFSFHSSPDKDICILNSNFRI